MDNEDKPKLSSKEQREKLKQEFLQELKLRKQILQQVKNTQKIEKLNSILQQIEKLSETPEGMDEFITKLNEEAALSDAKIDLSLQSTEQKQEPNPQPTAQELLKQFKVEMGLLEKETSSPEPPNETTPNENSKTIGDEEKSNLIHKENEHTSKTLGDEEHRT